MKVTFNPNYISKYLEKNHYTAEAEERTYEIPVDELETYLISPNMINDENKGEIFSTIEQKIKDEIETENAERADSNNFFDSLTAESNDSENQIETTPEINSDLALTNAYVFTPKEYTDFLISTYTYDSYNPIGTELIIQGISYNRYGVAAFYKNENNEYFFGFAKPTFKNGSLVNTAVTFTSINYGDFMDITDKEAIYEWHFGDYELDSPEITINEISID